MSKFLVLLLFLFICSILVSGKDPIIRIYKYTGKCDELPNPVAYYTRIRIYKKNNGQYIDQTLNVTQEIKSIDQMQLFLTKCEGRDNLDYCETFRNISIPHFGILLTNTNTPWGKRGIFNPPLVQPIKPGLYALNCLKMDASWAVLSISGFWRVKAKLFHKDKEILCMNVEGDMASR